MTELAVDCGVCGTKNVGATPRGAFVFRPPLISVFTTCNFCRAGLVVYAKAARTVGSPFDGDLLSTPNWPAILDDLRILMVHPKPDEPRTIEHLPPNVAGAFREGEEARALKHNLSAASSYRTALERALKALTPDEVRKPLFQRIEALAAANSIPDTMIDLMHEVRFLGNEIHEDEDPEPEDVQAGADFTALLLTYLFELPGRVEAAKAKRTAKG